MVRVKICGITRATDAAHACALGADAIGFIFYERSPRYIAPAAAAAIAATLPPHVARVGVFADATRETVEAVRAQVPLDAIQLHGRHDRGVLQRKNGVAVICAFNVGAGFRLAALETVCRSADALLLDGFRAGRFGGTGRAVDRGIARQAGRYGRIVLAGGLHPGNIAGAIAAAAPYAVDINSGVEDRPGRKNTQKLEQLFYEIQDDRREWQPATDPKFPLA